MEGHFFVRNVLSIKPVLMWGFSFQVSMANNIKNENGTWTNKLQQNRCLWTIDCDTILLWGWATREASWISQNPKCLVADVQSDRLYTYFQKRSIKPSGIPQTCLCPFCVLTTPKGQSVPSACPPPSPSLFPQRTDTIKPIGTSGNFCNKSGYLPVSLQTERREAENTLAFPDFVTPRRNVKGSFDFLCPLPTPCPGTGLFHFHGVGGMAWVGGSVLPTPWPAHGHHAHCPAHPLTQRSAQDCSPKWPASPPRHRGQHLVPMAACCPTGPWLGSRGAVEQSRNCWP